MTDPVIADLDTALLRLRRFLAEPARRLPDQAHGGTQRPVDLSSLLVVEALTRRGAPASVRELATVLGVAHSTASRFVDRASSAGLVVRVDDPTDARLQRARLTEQGDALALRARGFRQARLAGLLATWDERDRAAFARLLARFADDAGLP